MMAGDVFSESGAQPGDMEISHFAESLLCMYIYINISVYVMYYLMYVYRCIMYIHYSL